jgi:hypothetical protein
LPLCEYRQLEVLREPLDEVRLPAFESEYLGCGVGSLGPRGGLARQQFERIQPRRVVGPQSEQACGDFCAEAARRLEARVAGCGGKLARGVAQTEPAHQRRVELCHCDRSRRSQRRRRWLLSQTSDESSQLSARDRVRRPKRLHAPRHQPVRDDDPDLGLGPRSRQCRGLAACAGGGREHGKDGEDRKDAAHPRFRIGTSSRSL